MIGIITYDTPHRKTQDLVTALILSGYPDLHLIIIPWVERKNFQPLFKHRPSKCINISVEELADRLKISYSKVEVNDLNKFFTDNSFRHILIGGAGLLPAELVVNHKIINAHPGYLPNVKGLDAFKWAIYNEQPIGITTHYISDKTDEGELIERRLIPICFEDTFHNVSYRIYETEIEMLVNAVKLIDNGQVNYESLNDDRYAANKRMPHDHEIIMMKKFEELRKRSNSRSDI